MNRTGETVFAAALFLAAAALVASGCRPACTVVDLAHEACVIIPMVDANGQKYELKVPGPTAVEYLNTGKIGAARCPSK